MAVLADDASGERIPYADGWVTLSDPSGAIVFDERLWPMLSQAMGTHYGRGVFDFAAPNARGWTRLYVNPGFGMSLLPVRFLCPPTYAVVEVGRRGAAAAPARAAPSG